MCEEQVLRAVESIIAMYTVALRDNDLEMMLKLFAPDAKVHSLFAGEKSASDFFQNLFESSSRTRVEIRRLFFDVHDKSAVAAHIEIDALWNNRSPITFEVVDIFTFGAGNRIKALKIILDTYPMRMMR